MSVSVFSPSPTKSQQPHRQSSFVGLPPIVPGPGLGSALGIWTTDLDVSSSATSSDGHRSPSPPDQRPSPPSSSYQLNGRGGNNHQGASRISIMNQFHSSSHSPSAAAAAVPPHQQGHLNQGQYLAMQSSQSQQSVALQYPAGAQFSVGVDVNSNGNGMYQHSGSPPPGHSNGQPGVVYAGRQDIKGPVTSYQQVASPPAGSPPGMPSPSLMSNGQFVLPPGWKVESSQLQQPLTPRHHRPSPSISSLRQYSQQNYGIDKETGALSTRSVSPPTQSPVDSRRPGQPALVQSGGHSSQNAFAPPNPPFLQQQQQQQGSSLARTSTNLTQDSQNRDENDGRRSSNMFSSIRSRLAGNGHDSRDSLGSRPQANGVTEDGVSEASIPVDEQRRTGTPNFFGGSGNGQLGSQGAPRPGHGIGGTPPPVGGAPFSPPREKRSFFTRPSGPGPRSASSQEIRRPSTAEGTTGPPVVGFGPGQPKKRFSKLTGILNRDKSETQPSQPQGQPHAFVQSQRPSFQSQREIPLGNSMGLPGQIGPGGIVRDPQGSEFVRPRSATTGSRPDLSERARSPSAQGSVIPRPMGVIVEEERGRKPSGGTFLAGIFGKRSESKTREQRPPHSPPGLGQPQGMNPQGQVMVMQRQGQPGFFLPIQGSTLGIQGQPMVPPQGQYAGLAQQVQQQQAQQQQQFLGQVGRQGVPNNQVFMQGQNSSHFGVIQQQPSPGISPITQSSGSPLATQAPGGVSGQQQPTSQQQEGPQGYIPQRPQGQPPPLGVVQVATAVPIRQVSSSPNGTGQLSAGSSPGGQSDSSRQKSASVVNQIDVGGVRKQNADVQGTRSRAASNSVPQQSQQQQQQQQQQSIHIASLQAPIRKPINSTSPRNSAQLGPQDAPSFEQTQMNGITASAGSQPQSRNQQQGDSLHSTPRGSPAPTPEQQQQQRQQQPSPPGVPPKNLPASHQGQGLGLSQPPSWQNQSGAAQPSPTSQQQSVYRPSGPQIAAVVQSFSHQSPQSPWSIGRQGTPSQSGQPGQPGQHFSPDQSPQGMMMTPPPQEQRPEKEGPFSKLLGKSKTFVYQISEPQPSSDKPKSDKESKGVMGMLGAFKRDKTKQQQQVEVGKAPPGGPQWNIQSGQVPPGSQQQQPGQIPQGQQQPRRLPQMQMPPKAQQVMGIGEGEQKIVSTPDEMFHPQPQSPPQPQSQPQQQSQPQLQSQSQTQGQAFQGQTPAQTSPVQSQNGHQRFNSQSNFGYQKDRQSPPKTSQPFTQPQGQAQASQGVQHPGGRSSLGGAPQYEIGPSPQQKQQQQQQPAPQSMGQNHTPTAATAAHLRAHNLKQQIASHAPEPQYAPVPIPQGYTPVYGDGTPVPRPEVVRAASYGQSYPGVPYQGPPQQWAYPGMIPGQVPQGLPPHLAQQGWPQYPPYQGTPPPMMMAQGTPPPQQYAQEQQVSSPQPIQGQAAPPQMSYQQPGSQQAIHPQFVTSANGQLQNVPHQAGFSPQSANFASPRQDPPTSFDQGQASQSNGQTVAPQVQYQYAVVSDPAHAPVQTNNGGPPQTLTPESIKSQTVQEPSQTVPRSAFATVKPAAGQDQLQPPQGPNGNLVPQRQLSGASEVSSLTSVPATGQGSTGAQSDHTVSQIQQSSAIPEGSIVSSEPAYERPPVTLRDEGPRVETPHTATSAENDDIYGATPRQSAHATPVAPQHAVEHVIFSEAAQEPSTEPEAKFAGPLPSRSPDRSPERNPTFNVVPPSQQQGFVVNAPPVTVEPATPSSATTATTATTPTVAVTSKSSSPDGEEEEEPPSPTESELNRKNREASGEGAAPAATTTTATNGKPVQSSQEIFEEHKRRQLARDMEEKIAIFPTEPEPLVGQQRKRRDDDAPMMSATSYPGQEWNPYGDMWVDDDV